MTMKPVSTRSIEDVEGRVASRSGQQKQVLFSGSEGLPAGLRSRSALRGQQGQHPRVFAGAVVSETVVVAAFAVCMASKQHQPCGNAKSRLQAKTSDLTTRFLIL